MELSTKLPAQGKVHFYRIMVVALLALVLAHLLSYQKLPFSADYQFPLITFAIIFGCGTIICTINYLISGKLNISGTDREVMIKESLIHAGITSLVYTVLYLILFNVIFNVPFHPVGYFKYLLISNVIILFEYVLFKALRNQESTNTTTSILLHSGKRQYRINWPDIALIHSSNGIVTFVLSSGERIISQYRSLEEVDQSYPAQLFFRANRQLLIHKESVKCLSSDINRKLILELYPQFANGSIGPVKVSRYKSKEFREWFLH